MQKYNPIQVTTKDDIILNGVYAKGDRAKTACIFIHGYSSHFTNNKIFEQTAEKLTANSHAVILAQTRGSGTITKFKKSNGDDILIGSYKEKLEDAHLDISAYIKFLINENYTQFTLIGYSMGTIKVIRYLFEGQYKNKIQNLVLLAPYDKNAFLENFAPGKMQQFVKTALQKIKEGKADHQVPTPEFNDDPITYETFYSWYQNTALNSVFDFYRKNYDFPILKKINIPVKIILGETDEFTNYPKLNETSGSVLSILGKSLKFSQTTLIPKANHAFTNHEETVAWDVNRFIEDTRKHYKQHRLILPFKKALRLISKIRQNTRQLK